MCFDVRFKTHLTILYINCFFNVFVNISWENPNNYELSGCSVGLRRYVDVSFFFGLVFVHTQSVLNICLLFLLIIVVFVVVVVSAEY